MYANIRFIVDNATYPLMTTIDVLKTNGLMWLFTCVVALLLFQKRDSCGVPNWHRICHSAVCGRRCKRLKDKRLRRRAQK